MRDGNGVKWRSGEACAYEYTSGWFNPFSVHNHICMFSWYALYIHTLTNANSLDTSHHFASFAFKNK